MAWYRTGTASITNGAAAVSGTLTAWMSQAKAEDRISFDGGGKWYEIASVEDNTGLTLATNFAETTVTGGAYVIDRSGRGWSVVSSLAASIAALLTQYPVLAGVADAAKLLRVNSAGDGLEVADIVGAPAPTSGDALKLVRVNAAEDDLELVAGIPLPELAGGGADAKKVPVVDAAGTGIDYAPVTIDPSTGAVLAVPSINSGPLAGFRNRLMNGCMRVNQRGLYWPGSATTADDKYCFDRWYMLAEDGDVASAVTFTNASSNVGWTSHNRAVGDSFRLTTTGALPTNFATATTYYVVSVVNANTITISATPGGGAITAGSAGSGTHTATGPSITPSLVNTIEDGWPHALRLKQNQTTTARFGAAQIIEYANCVDLRGKTVTLSARVRLSSSATLRYAILEWTGTADTVTSDVVNSWSNATYTAGQFFNSTTLTVAAVGSTALTANTAATISLSATISSSANNLIVLAWTEAAAAQNVTLDIGKVQLEIGATATAFEFRPIAAEGQLCQRYFEQLSGGTGDRYIRRGFANTTGAQYQPIQFFGQKRVAPTVALIGISSTNTTNVQAFNPSFYEFEFYHEVSSSGGYTFFGYAADAEL